jgi:hypothetical protein
MRTNNFLRVAALSLALVAPAFGSAHANSIYDYNYAQDVWPQVQAARNAPVKVADAATVTRTDAGQAQGTYDRGDRNIDPHTGDRVAGITLGGF